MLDPEVEKALKDILPLERVNQIKNDKNYNSQAIEILLAGIYIQLAKLKKD